MEKTTISMNKRELNNSSENSRIASRILGTHDKDIAAYNTHKSRNAETLLILLENSKFLFLINSGKNHIDKKDEG